MKYRTSTGWIINTKKLKRDDYLFLKTLQGEQAQQNFIDECFSLYLKAWRIDLADYEASMEGRS